MTESSFYPGTTVLRNRRGITDKEELARAEAYFVGVRLATIGLAPVERTFTAAHLRALHGWLFGDVYDWAGNYRSEDFSKGGTHFWPHDLIDARLTKVLVRLHEGPLLSEVVEDEVFLSGLALLYLDLNHVHPFREGNGRAQRSFLADVAQVSGRSVDWTLLDKDRNDRACAAATRSQNPAPLRALLEPLILAPGDPGGPAAARLIYAFRDAAATAGAAGGRSRRGSTPPQEERDRDLVLKAIEAGLELTRLSEQTRELADRRRAYVRELAANGRTMEWIALRLGITKSAVQKILGRP
ncbi:Fic family protein [Nocardioides sp. BP30]|uniref:Fic/DOC family protein n=1 Tax=Nocardioides sp. BP30 TaxID=3036374 RepID=UPI0024688D46|nr:Fic family protein [Nocardioides sp. BP30]WGL51843.1 Fic family protein [Nocardioides sp. BP30]